MNKAFEEQMKQYIKMKGIEHKVKKHERDIKVNNIVNMISYVLGLTGLMVAGANMRETAYYNNEMLILSLSSIILVMVSILLITYSVDSLIKKDLENYRSVKKNENNCC